jgi:hypothetical protein
MEDLYGAHDRNASILKYRILSPVRLFRKAIERGALEFVYAHNSCDSSHNQNFS